MFKPKLFSLLKHRKTEFTKKRVLADIGAGLYIAFLLIPLSIALGITSGVEPGKGLITAVVAGFIVSIFGGSRVQVGGPLAVFAIIVPSIVKTYGTTGLITALAMAGIFLILMGILKFGTLIKYIPDPIIIGFTAGVAVVLFSNQMNDFFGMGLQNIPSAFIAKWKFYIQNVSNINISACLLGFGTILLIVFYPKKLKFFPATFAALFITSLIVALSGIPLDTIAQRYGAIKDSVTFLPKMPDLTIDMIVHLIQPALIIAILAGVESLLSAVVSDGMIGKRHNSNTELIAQGLANIGSALFGGLPASGAISRTGANIAAGGRTPIAGIAHAVFILLIMIFFMDYFAYIPMVTIAALLIIVCYNMADWKGFFDMRKAPKSDIAILMTTFLLTVFLDLIYAIEIGMVLAAFLFMKRMANFTKIDESDDVYESRNDTGKSDIDKKKVQDVMVYEINGPFFFGATGAFIEQMEKIEHYKAVILRMRKMPIMDATAYRALLRMYKKSASEGIRLILCQVQRQPLKVMKNYGFIDIIGRENFALNIDTALRKAEKFTSAVQEKK